MTEIRDRLHEAVSSRLGLLTVSLGKSAWQNRARRLVEAMGGSCSKGRERKGGASTGDGGNLLGGGKGFLGLALIGRAPNEGEVYGASRLLYAQRHAAEVPRGSIKTRSLLDICVDVLCDEPNRLFQAQFAEVPLDMMQVNFRLPATPRRPHLSDRSRSLTPSPLGPQTVFDRLAERGRLTLELTYLFEPACLSRISLPSYPGVTDEWLLVLASAGLCSLNLSDCTQVASPPPSLAPLESFPPSPPRQVCFILQ